MADWTPLFDKPTPQQGGWTPLFSAPPGKPVPELRGTPLEPSGPSVPASDDPRGILSRMGEGISSGFGQSKVTPQESEQHPYLALAGKALELPGRVGGAVIGGAAGAASGLAEKAGMSRVNADRLMRDLGVVGQAVAVESGTGGMAHTPTTPVPRQHGLPRMAPIEAAESVGEAVKQKAAETKALKDRQYEQAFSQPGEFKNQNSKVADQIRERFKADPTVIIDKEISPKSFAALDGIDKHISELKGQTETGQLNLRGVDHVRQRLNTLWSDAKGNDRRVMRKVINAYDDIVEKTIEDGLFSGDPKVLDTLRDARKTSSYLKRTFGPAQKGDDAGLAVRKIVERGATPEEIANMMLGAGKIGATGLPVRLWDRLTTIVGPESKVLSDVRAAMWQKATQRKGGPKDLANSTIGQKMFSPRVLDMMRRYKGPGQLGPITAAIAGMAAGAFIPSIVTKPVEAIAKAKYGGVE